MIAALLALLLAGCVSHPVYGCFPVRDQHGRDALVCTPLKPQVPEKPPVVVPPPQQGGQIG